MKKYAAVAAIVVALGVGGCAVTPTQTSWTPASQQVAPATNTDAEPAALVEFVQQAWNGEPVPDAHWIQTTALIACKHMIGGETVNIEADNKTDDDNYDMLITAARKLTCGEAFTD